MRSTVAVIIPTYSRPRFLREALLSVAAQTRPADEIIVVDDGSPTAEARAICGEFPSVNYVRQHNAGLSEARNTGFRHSTSELLVFLDDDDRLLPNALEVQEQALLARPAAGVVYGRIHLIDADGQFIGENLRNHKPPTNALAGFLTENFVQIQAVMLRRQVLERLGLFRGFMGEDLDLWLRLAAAGVAFEFIDMPLAEYRKLPVTMSSDKLRHAQGLLEKVEANLHLFPPGRLLRYTAHYHHRVGRAAMDSGDKKLARTHLLRAVLGQPANLRFAAYWLLCYLPQRLMSPFDWLRQMKRKCVQFLADRGWLEQRWQP